MHIHIAQPRETAVERLKQSIAPELWQANAQFVEHLKQQIAQHPLSSNPMIGVLNSGTLSAGAVKTIHLEYRYAIVQIFTDALLMAQYQTRQLEPRLTAGSKMIARFLLTLNILDEFGFQPGVSTSGYYQGNPAYAHYPLFENVLDELDISSEAREQYQPSQISIEVRQYMEQGYTAYIDVLALLAVAEQQVILYSPPLRQATRGVGLNVDHGYYYVHGISTDNNALAADDDHEDDLWYALTQACTPQDYEHVSNICLNYCNLWDNFWQYQYKTHCHIA